MVASLFFLSYLFSSFIFADETMCGDPEQPLYSTIQRLSDQSIVYACLKGYKMEAGDPRRDCVNGVWTGPPPPRCSGPIDPPLLFIFFYSLMFTRRRNEVVVGKVITEKSWGGRFLWGQELRFGLDLGQMANFLAFIASKSFDI